MHPLGGTYHSHEDGERALLKWLEETFDKTTPYPMHRLNETPGLIALTKERYYWESAYWHSAVLSNGEREIMIPQKHRQLFLARWLPSLMGHSNIFLVCTDGYTCGFCGQNIPQNPQSMARKCVTCTAEHINLTNIRQLAPCISLLPLPSDVIYLLRLQLAKLGTAHFVNFAR